MRFGKLKIYIFVFIFFLENTITLFAVDKIESIPLINLEELSPTFEEDKDVLEKKDEQNSSIENDENFNKEKITINTDKIYINITALDKITAKTLSIKLGIGEKKYFGSLEIIGLKCQLSEIMNLMMPLHIYKLKILLPKITIKFSYLMDGLLLLALPCSQ